MFNFFKRLTNVEDGLHHTATNQQLTDTKIKAFEDYLSVDFFHGDKSKPHYRKRKVVVKKLGRPRKNK